MRMIQTLASLGANFSTSKRCATTSGLSAVAMSCLLATTNRHANSNSFSSNKPCNSALALSWRWSDWWVGLVKRVWGGRMEVGAEVWRYARGAGKLSDDVSHHAVNVTRVHHEYYPRGACIIVPPKWSQLILSPNILRRQIHTKTGTRDVGRAWRGHTFRFYPNGELQALVIHRFHIETNGRLCLRCLT